MKFFGMTRSNGSPYVELIVYGLVVFVIVVL